MALSRLPPTDVELWTDGSAIPGVGAGAGFVIYINSQLHVSEAHPASLESSDFRAESVTMSLGVTALTALKDSYSYSSIRIFTDCQTLISTLSRGPARQPDSACTSIWIHLSSISKITSIHVQWIPAHVGIPGNTLADFKAKQGSTLPQTSVPIDLSTAKVLIRRTDQEEFHARYIRDPHSATHRTLTGETNLQAHWRFGWTRSQCVTVAQLRTGHCPLLASYLHRIGRQQSPVCPHCGGDDETALCCPAHASA